MIKRKSMLMTFLPSLIPCFKDFASIQSDFLGTGEINLGRLQWIYPTTFLPTISLLLKNPGAKYYPPQNTDAASYIENMLKSGLGYKPSICSYVPPIPLPDDESKLDPVLAEVYRLNNDGKEYGGQNAFKYLIGELVANIYEHSKFNHAFIMAQKYQKKGFVDISIFDDGITIPGSLSIAGMIFNKDVEFIGEAINGLSSKKLKERGYGLHTNVRICTEGLGANMMIASRQGLLNIEGKEQKGYILKDEYKLSGTSISIRIPYPAKEVDIYAYQN
ncbi:MAG: hypothetical protein A4E32_00309 [Methanomassiliicoccales archaeon PtaU1.Bin124]|nr:MAG: hypothetical protein A4E32_00309 [Methanomassiliicoccales archaeon PtaU1.Bin124]